MGGARRGRSGTLSGFQIKRQGPRRKKMTMKINRYSARLTEDVSQPGSRAMLHAAGLTLEDMSKAQVGIASTGYESNPCNMHLNGLAVHIKKGVQEAGMIGWIFNTIGISDGISNGTTGMNYSLPSRD